MTKLEKEKQSLEYDKKQVLERFEYAKQETIKILTEATSKTITELDNYTYFSSLKRYANELEIIEAKLRVVNYLADNSRK